MSVPTDREKVPCPNCGGPVYLTDQQCLNCGVKLDEGRLAEQPAGSGGVGSTPAGAPPTGDYPPVEPVAPARAPYQIAPGADRWRPADLVGNTGIMASLSRAWAFFRESLSIAVKDTDVIIPSVLAMLANLVMIGLIIAILHLTGLLGPLLEDDSEGNILTYVILVGATLIGYIISYLLTSMTVNMVDAYLRGEDAHLGVAWDDAVQNVGAILWLAVVATLVNMLTSSMRSKKGRGLSDLAADGIDKAWQVASLLVLPIIIIEDISFSDASRRAMGLHRGNIVQLVIGEIGLTLLQKIVGFLLVIIGIAPPIIAYSLSGIGMVFYLSVSWAALVLVVTQALLMYVRTAFYTCVYLWAVASEESSAQVPAPAPLAKALQA